MINLGLVARLTEVSHETLDTLYPVRHGSDDRSRSVPGQCYRSTTIMCAMFQLHHLCVKLDRARVMQFPKRLLPNIHGWLRYGRGS